jgi:hypothetical protein
MPISGIEYNRIQQVNLARPGVRSGLITFVAREKGVSTLRMQILHTSKKLTTPELIIDTIVCRRLTLLNRSYNSIVFLKSPATET